LTSRDSRRGLRRIGREHSVFDEYPEHDFGLSRLLANEWKPLEGVIVPDVREDTNAIYLEGDITRVYIKKPRKVDTDIWDIGCVITTNLLEERGYVLRGAHSRTVSWLRGRRFRWRRGAQVFLSSIVINPGGYRFKAPTIVIRI
jgi:hypothetical protein